MPSPLSIQAGRERPKSAPPLPPAAGGADIVALFGADEPASAPIVEEEDSWASLRLHLTRACSQPADPLLSATAERLRRSRMKRLVDLAGAGLGLLFLSPFLLLIAGLITLDSRGGPIFSQHRSGLGGEPFRIFKFRTMTVRENGAEIIQARRGDERVTRLGQFLRRTSLDELPQLLNVLRGEMSLVGPRPHALAHDLLYAAALTSYGFRFLAKPGISGLAQVSGLRGATPDLASMAARVEKDIDYIREWSFWLDVRILCRTLRVFAFHPRAV